MLRVPAMVSITLALDSSGLFRPYFSSLARTALILPREDQQKDLGRKGCVRNIISSQPNPGSKSSARIAGSQALESAPKLRL